ncbi:ankyrin repeat domain-containing protein [Actimicrobium antarcticum]|uniref:Ankyrin repeat domain-containing protein n=1 Tax=Actimicrobium antarcticum TaxID=1051899 RepID=A0ABP7U0T2_9BURK
MDAIRRLSQQYRQQAVDAGSPDTTTAPLIPAGPGSSPATAGSASMRGRVHDLLGRNRPITRLLSSYGLATPRLRHFSDAQVDTVGAALAYLVPQPTTNSHAMEQHIVNACTFGTGHQFSAVLRLIEEGIINPHSVGPAQANLLCEMAAHGTESAEPNAVSLDTRVRMLVRHGADPYRCDSRDRSPLEVAWSDNRDDGATVGDALLSAGFNPRVTDFRGTTMLHRAAVDDNLTLMGHWFAAALPVNLRDPDRVTPLMAAAAMNRAVSVRALLTHPDIEVDAVDREGFTALHCAIFSGQLDAVALLLEHGANPLLRTTCWATPLKLAETIAASRDLPALFDLVQRATTAGQR